MKPKALRHLLAIAGSSLIAVGSASAQTTYTWANSNVTGTPTASRDWFGGSAGTWTGGTPVSSNLNTIQFFQDTTTALGNTATPSSQTVNLNNGGSAFQLGTLTLSGLASATNNANLTMTLSGDALNFSALTGLINLDALNATRTITYNVNNNIQLGTASSGSVLNLTGNGTGTFNIGGIISELQSGGGSLVKSGSSTVTLSGNNSYSGGTTISVGTLAIGTSGTLGSNVNTNNISVAAGARLTLAAAGNTGANQTITLNNTAGSLSVLGLGYVGLPSAAITFGNDTGVLAINTTGYNTNLTSILSGKSIFLGSTGTGTFSGGASTIAAGSGSIYRLGGGGGTLTISSANALTGANAVQVGSTATNGTGTVVFSASQDFTGGMTVNTGSTVNFSTSQTYSGGFTLNGGTVTGIGSGTYGGFGTGTFYASNGTLNFTAGSTQTIGNALSWGGGNLVFTRSSGATPVTTWTGDLTLTGNQTLTLGASTTANSSTFSGNISGDFALTIAGPTNGASLTLSGTNNTFSGGLTMNSANVALNINSATALGTGTFTLTATGAINNTSGAAITLANNNALAINSNFTFTGSNDLNMGTGAVNLGAGTRQITTTAGTLTLGGVISNGGLTKLGAGTLVLSGTSSNTYGTVTTVSAGILELNKTSNATRAIAAGGVSVVGSTLRYAATAGNDQIDDSALVTLANGAGVATLNLNGISDTIGSLTIGGGSGTTTSQGVVTTGAGTLTLAGNLTYTSTGNSTVTSTISGNLDLGSSTRTFTIGDSTGTTTELAVSALISGTGVGLIKTGTGTMQLSGANTFNGTTTVTQGILSLDFTSGNNRIKSGNALTLNGGTLQFTNLGTNTQTFGATTLNSATASSITRSGTYTSGVSDLGTLSGSGTLDVSNLSASPTWIRASGNASQTFLLNGQVTANSGASFVRTDASGNLLTVTTSDFANNAIIGNNAGTSIRLVTGGGTGTGPTGSGFVGLSTVGTTDFDSILNRYTTGTVTIDVTNSGANASNILRMGSYGLMYSSSGASLTIGTDVANGGILTAGGADNTAGTIYVNGSNDTTINSAIQNNGMGVVGLNKSGSGILTVAGASTFTGGLVLNAGTLRLTNASNVITGGITLNGGTFGDNTGAISTTTLNNNLITVNGAVSLGLANNATTNGGITLNAGSVLTLGTNGGGATINGAVTGTGSLISDRLSSSGSSHSLNSTSNTFTGTISFVSGATMSLSVNSLADSASLGAGNIRFAAGSSSQTFALGSGAIAPVTLNNRRIELAVNNTSSAIIANNSAQAFTINTDLLVGATTARTLELSGSGTGLGSFNGIIANGSAPSLALTKSGTGTWVLGNSANSYTGTTQISDGRLVINSIGALGAGSSAIILGGPTTSGTLEYTGAEVSTSRTFQIGTNNNATGAGGILNNGTGTLTFTNATFNQTYSISHTQARTLTLGGTNDGVIQGTIQNSSGTATNGVTKVGSGTWTLGGTNTYTGTTTVSGGILQFGKVSSLYNGTTASWTAANIRVANGGTLAFNVGGTGEFSSSDVGTLFTNLANSTNATTNGMAAGSRFGFDTTNASGGSFEISQVVANSGGTAGGARGLIKLGTGTLVLSATNTYTGATNVNQGTLAVNGSLTSSVTVASGATLGGSGTINSSVTIQSGGFINPGNSPGTINIGNLVQAGTFIAEITESTGGAFDQINVTGTVDITSGSLQAAFSAGTYALNDMIFILLNDGTDAITGTYTGFLQGATVTSYGGFDWQISYTGNSTGNTFTGGNDIVLMAASPIPEPSTALLGALGVLLFFRRRR